MGVNLFRIFTSTRWELKNDSWVIFPLWKRFHVGSSTLSTLLRRERREKENNQMNKSPIHCFSHLHFILSQNLIFYTLTKLNLIQTQTHIQTINIHSKYHVRVINNFITVGIKSFVRYYLLHHLSIIPPFLIKLLFVKN